MRARPDEHRAAKRLLQNYLRTLKRISRRTCLGRVFRLADLPDMLALRESMQRAVTAFNKESTRWRMEVVLVFQELGPEACDKVVDR